MVALIINAIALETTIVPLALILCIHEVEVEQNKHYQRL